MKSIPEDTIRAVEHRFHAVIRERVERLAERPDLDLPSLAEPLPRRRKPAWYPVPGVAGGFQYWWEGRGRGARLIVESWSRAAEGSGQRHEITADRTVLVAEGFV